MRTNICGKPSSAYRHAVLSQTCRRRDKCRPRTPSVRPSVPLAAVRHSQSPIILVRAAASASNRTRSVAFHTPAPTCTIDAPVEPAIACATGALDGGCPDRPADHSDSSTRRAGVSAANGAAASVRPWPTGSAGNYRAKAVRLPATAAIFRLGEPVCRHPGTHGERVQGGVRRSGLLLWQIEALRSYVCFNCTVAGVGRVIRSPGRWRTPQGVGVLHRGLRLVSGDLAPTRTIRQHVHGGRIRMKLPCAIRSGVAANTPPWHK